MSAFFFFFVSLSMEAVAWLRIMHNAWTVFSLVLLCFICATCVTPGVPREPTLSYTHVLLVGQQRPSSGPWECFISVSHRAMCILSTRWQQSAAKVNGSNRMKDAPLMTPGMTSAGTLLQVPWIHLNSEWISVSNPALASNVEPWTFPKRCSESSCPLAGSAHVTAI